MVSLRVSGRQCWPREGTCFLTEEEHPMRSKPSAIALVVSLVVSVAVLAQAPPSAQAPSSYSLWEFGTIPRPAFKEVLLGNPAVQAELKITEAQNKAKDEKVQRIREKIQKARREITDRAKFVEARDSIYKEIEAAILENLTPQQCQRLEQIQLQSQGPLAFYRASIPALAAEGPDPIERLKLTDDQIKQITAIATEGNAEISKAAELPIVLDPKDGVPTPESIKKLVGTEQFNAAKKKTREAARKAWDSVIARVERVLSETQRTAYREMLGPPFDLHKIRFSDDETSEDAANVANALNVGGGGGGGGQQSDPTFDTKVARPSYMTEHPRVLFDEAHHNFHTTDGRYKPFADVIANDGFKVIPNKQKFTKDLLSKGEILIIANALGADGMGANGASNSAFTEAECTAVRDWVREGGSLLLITDHAPFGSAAQSLANQFGVDMSKGHTADPSNSEGGETSLVFSRKNNLLGDHPIMKGRDDSERINRIQTFTGQSLKGPAGSVAILKLGDTAVDEGDDGNPRSAAGRAQGIAFPFGKGRVVVMGEAAELSAQRVGNERFGMNVPGLDNRQMALNIMHWLSGLLEPREKGLKKAG
jgi:hypothetical protein